MSHAIFQNHRPVTSIVLDSDEFQILCEEAYGHPVEITYDANDGVYVDTEEDLCETLTDCLGVPVSSVHMMIAIRQASGLPIGKENKERRNRI